MVHFETVGEVADTDSLLTVRARYDDHFVAAVDQALGQVVDVHLYTSEVWHEKVRNHCDSELFSWLLREVEIARCLFLLYRSLDQRISTQVLDEKIRKRDLQG